MTTRTYTGRIKLKSGGFPIEVSINSTSNSSAQKTIEAQYGNQFKSWDKQMTA
jgi:hypothetical protein